MPEPKNKQDAIAVHDIDWNSEIPDEALVTFVDVHYTAAKQRRMQWEIDAATQLAWARGNQELRWDEDIKDLIDSTLSMPEHIPMEQRLPVKINAIKAQVLQKMALLVSRPVTWRSRPITGDDADLAAARLTTDLLQYDWFNSENPIAGIRLMQAAWTLFCTGVIFLKPIWDPSLGPIQEFGPRSMGMKEWAKSLVERLGRALHPGEMNPTSGKIEMHEGEPRLEFVTGFDLSEPVFTSDITPRTSWLIHSSWVTMEELRSEFGEEATKDIQPDDDADAWKSGFRAIYGRQQETAQGATVEPGTMVLKHELWRPHSDAAKKGYLAVVAHDQLLTKGPNPYKHGKLPFIRLAEIPDPDLFRPPCTVSNLMSLQESRNRIRSAMNSYTMMLLDPRMAKEKDSGLPSDAFSPGPRVVEVAQGALVSGMIKPLVWGPMPPEAFRMDEMADNDMKDVGGVHDASLGKRQEKGESGKRVELLQAGDARANGIVRELVERALATAGDQMIGLWWQFGGEKRMIGLTKGSRTETVKFKSSDLMHLAGSKDKRTKGPILMVEVHIEPEPDLEGELRTVEVLAKLKFIDPLNPADERRVRRLLGEHVVRETDEDTRQRANAMDENDSLLAGDTPTLAIGDWDQQHIDEHMQGTTTEQFRKAIKINPEVGRMFEAHIRAHEYQKATKVIRPKIIEGIIKQVEAARIGEALKVQPQPAAPRANGRPTGPPGGGQAGLRARGVPQPQQPQIGGVRPGGVGLQ